MANPDDRSDNVEKLQNALENTMQNVHQSEDFLKAHSDEMHENERKDVESKNRRREEAIEGFRAEIKDEVHDPEQ